MLAPTGTESGCRVIWWLLRSHGNEPKKTVTDKLRGYGVAHRALIPETIHVTDRYANKRADALSLVSIRFVIASLIAWSVVGLFHDVDETIVPWRVAILIGVFQTFGVMAPVHIALGSEAPAVVDLMHSKC